jgi:diacylglycerol kinase (ATP)
MQLVRLVRAMFIYNAKSGGAVTEEELLERLQAIGWGVDRSLSEKELDDCIGHGVDVVVVAGGDGTIARVAKRLAGTDVPMAIIPMGTANNVARSLGLGVEPSSAVLALGRATERHIDLGVVKSQRREDYFLEGFGVGVLAHVMAEKAGENEKRLPRALALIADELEDYEPRPLELEADGTDHSGEYVMAAVMNVRSLGPALTLAPDAKCDDGKLDLVLVRPESKRILVAHLRRAAEEGDIALPAFERTPVKHVRLRADGRVVHIDDAVRQFEGDIHVDVAPGAVKLLAPPQSPRALPTS